MKKQFYISYSSILFILGLLTFFPLMGVGFTTNDDTHVYHFFHFSCDHIFSQILNLFKVSFHVFTTTTRPTIGNLFISPVLHLINFSYTNPPIMRLLSILFHVINITLFYKIISHVFKDKSVGTLAALLFLVFIQNSWEHNILVSYITYAFLFSLLLISFYLFLHYQETGKSSYQLASSIFFLLGLSYEINIIYLPLFLFFSLVIHHKADWIKKVLAECKIHLIFILIFILIFFVFRLMAPNEVKDSVTHDSSASNQTIESLGYYFALGRDRWFLILKTIYKFGISTFPTYIFIHAKTFIREYYDCFQLTWLIKSLIAAFALYQLLHLLKNSAKNSFLIPGIAISLYLIFAPGAPLSIIYKYQEWVKIGTVSFTSSYNSFFGMVLLFVILIYHLFYFLNKIKNNSLRVYFQYKFIFLITVSVAMVSLVTDYSNAAFTKSQIQSQRKWDIYDRFLKSDQFKALPNNSVIYAPTLFDSIGIVANFKPYWTDYTAYKTGGWKNVLNSPELIPAYLKDPKVAFTKSKNILIINNYENLKPYLPNKNLYFIKYAQEKKDPNQYLLFAKVTEYTDYGTELDLLGDKIHLFVLSKYQDSLVFGQHENSYFSLPVSGTLSSIEIPKIDLESVGLSNFTNAHVNSSSLSIQFGAGFYQGEATHRWSDKTSKLNFINRSNSAINIEVAFVVNNFENEKSLLTIANDSLYINKDETVYTKKISIKSHSNYLLAFNSSAPRVNAPMDPRQMYFMLKKLRVTILK